MMSRCPACAYSLRELEGAPREPLAAFERDIACPECGFVVPAGSRVVVGGVSAYTMGGKGGWTAFWPWILMGAFAVLVLIPNVLRGIFAWIGGNPIDTVSFLCSLVALIGVPFIPKHIVASLRARRAGRMAEEVNESNEALIAARSILCASGWLVVFDRALTRPTIVVVDARLVRNISVVEQTSGSGVTRTAAHEVSARILPPGPPGTVPVFVRGASDPSVFAWALCRSIRATPVVDMPQLVERWQHAGQRPSFQLTMRRIEGRARRSADLRFSDAVEIDPATRACVVRGSPYPPAHADPAAAVRANLLALFYAVFATMAMGGALLFLQGGRPSWVAAIPIIVIGTSISALALLRRRNIWRRHSEVAEWRVASAKVLVKRGKQEVPISAAAIRSIDLATALGVPYLTITAGKSTKPDATLIPDDWGGRSPEKVLAQIRAVLRPKVPGIGGSANAAQ